MPPYLLIPLIGLGALLALCLVNVLIYCLLLVRPRGRAPADGALLCDYAHRGLHGTTPSGEVVPENSLAAFARACEAGVGIELDVQLSRDGTVMVFHDYTLSRMTGVERRLAELTARELEALSLAGTAETVPTFAEVLRLVDGRVPLLIELKGENLDTSLCRAVADCLAGYSGSYCIESFNPLLLRGMRKQLPDAYCGLLYTNLLRDKKKRTVLNAALTVMAFNFLCKPNFIACNGHDRCALPVRLATGLYRAPRFVWTLRTEGDISEAHALGECAIFERTEDLS